MSGFSPDWLDLREAADHRSRDRGLLTRLARHLHDRDVVQIVDLGCGTGSNLRATAPALGPRQQWTLVDYDPVLLNAARERLSAWADSSRREGDRLVLEKAGRTITVGFRQADLVKHLDAALGATPALVTASALFDLCSAEFVHRVAGEVARRHAAFYTVLTYDGGQSWTPAHPADDAMAAAFNAHQATDKGFGISAGPNAPTALAEAFRAQSYEVLEASTPWQLSGPDDQALIDALAGGFAGAVAETGRVSVADLAAWRAIRHTGSVVGHTDTLALPPA